MKSNNSSVKTHSTIAMFRLIAGYSIGLFLLLMLMSVFVVLPHINGLFKELNEEDIKIELKKEVALFESFIQTQKQIVENLATLPGVTGVVMLSDTNNQAVNHLLDNVIVRGKKGRLILQDIDSNILVKTTNDLQGQYTGKQRWIDKILDGTMPYHFQLLSQRNNFILFKISVPVLYNGYVEGVLSLEIDFDIKDMFVIQLLNPNVAITLTQSQLTVGSDVSHIELARENSHTFEDIDVVLTYITDDALILKKEREAENLIFSVLLFSLTLSFIAFVLLSYSGFIHNHKTASSEGKLFKVYALPIIVALIGSSTSFTSFVLVFNNHNASQEQNLIFDSKKQIEDIREKLNTYLNVLDAINAFYQVSDFIDRNTFKNIVSAFINKNNSVFSFQWLPYISHFERSLHEKNAQKAGFSHYAIKELNQNNELVVAKNRDYYLPVFYAEPLSGNTQFLGFDNASIPKRLSLLNKAKETGNKAITAKIQLIQDEHEQASILIFDPVFHTFDKDNLIEKGELLGFTLLLLRVEDFINSLLVNNNLSLFIQDISTPDDPKTLFGNAQSADLFSRYEIINLAGRSWRITTYNKNIAGEIFWPAWITLIAGLTLTGVIVLGLINLVRRREDVEQLVILRTAELSASEEQHRAVVENAVDGLLTIDELGIIEKFNPAAEKIFGYRAKDVIGTNINILMPDIYRDEQHGYFKNYRDADIKEIIGIGHYVKGKRKNDTMFPIDLSVSEMQLGNVKKFSGIVRDISERVAFENERKQFIEQLTDSNEELERFAYVCSHDLQEPLRMIRSFSEKLQEHIKSDLENDEKGKKYFNFVIDGAIRAQSLITDILSYSSISNDTKQLEEVHIESLIDVIKINTLDDKTQSNGTITYDPLPTIQGNKTQLLQLFQNLINNGLKYQKAGADPIVHVSVKDRNEYWLFTVRDNGIGMEERHFKKIFEVFQRLHRKSKYAGTGIGLSICKKVVERHGGTIWVGSEKNIGSTFYFTLLKAKK